EGSTDSVYAVDEDYRYIFVNDAHLSHMVDSGRISQKRSEKLIGKKYQNFHPKTESEKFLENIKKVFNTGKPVRFEFKWPGTERWSNRVLSPIKDLKTGKVKSVSVISRDITEQKQAEKALNDSRRMLQTVLDTLPVGVFWKDRNSKYLGANRAWLTAAGLKSSKEVIGKSGYDLPWSKEETESFQKDDKRIIKSGLPKYDIIQPFLKTDGTHSWAKTNKVPLLDSEGKVIGILGTYEDITERKKAEEALANKEAELRSLLEGSTDSVYAVDEDYRYIFVNDAHLSHMVDSGRISQKRSEELIGKKYQDFHPKTESEKFLENIKKVFNTGKPVRFEFKWPGKERWSNRVISPIKDLKTGKVKSVSVISRDITERKKTEAEKEKYQSMLLQSQKMEAVGTLAGGIAHDFNNILSSIKGYIQLCLEDLEKETQMYNNLEQVLIATNRAKSLVSQILAFSRQSKHKMKPVRISQIVEEVTKLLMSTISTKIKVRKQLKTKKDIVLADTTEIHQVLLNLCTNAVQAMQEKGGILEISLTNVGFDSDELAEHPHITRESKELAAYPHITRESYVKLSICDTGCGMDSTTVSRIFEPFFTTKKQNKGTGLGLAVVHGIIQEHKGIITVKSKPGKGTTFHIYLPELKQKKHA
ncbi:MAG: PAS domain-containing protein, partial [bacterium]